MRIVYYGEFDPFSGIGQTASEFRVAVAQVSLSCLVSDVVIVQPGNLLEHSLTLPVFEHLAPFVRAGRLTTTADGGAASPREYLEAQMEKTLARSSRATGRDGAERRRALDELRCRYSDRDFGCARTSLDEEKGDSEPETSENSPG